MARIDPIPPDRMTDDQRRVDAAIAATRIGGNAGGPFGLWLRTPELAEKADALGTYLRHNTTVPQKLVELAVLTVARHWNAQYEWFVHAQLALKAGIDASVIDAIRARRRPEFTDPADEAVYALAMEINQDRAVSDETYARAVETLGEQTVLDLVTTIGFYVMVAVVLVTYRVDVPGGGTPLDP